MYPLLQPIKTAAAFPVVCWAYAVRYERGTDMTQRGGSGHWTAADVGDQSGRVAVITGATSGLGLETARVLAQHGATVVLAARDPAKTAAAASGLRAAPSRAPVQNGPVETAELD